MQVILGAAWIASALSVGLTATSLAADAPAGGTVIYFDAVSNQRSTRKSHRTTAASRRVR
jgi:hypothetical protein